MSRQDVLKAELKARRSSRELEQGLDHLAGKVEEGVLKANELKARATQVADRVKHPRETAVDYVGRGTSWASRRSRDMAASARARYETTPLRTKRLIAGAVAALGAAVIGILVYQRRRRRDLVFLGVAAEQERRAGMLGEGDIQLTS